MPAWWSPLSDGIQRLVDRTLPPGRAVPGAPVADAAPTPMPPTRPPQAWPWQPPIQRAINPTWQPALRPDDFAASLSSHQDPTLRRDLVHEVRPSVGGLVDGLADLVPGQPGIRQPTSELTVRPVRPARPEVQRTLTSFASSSVGDDLTTVQVEAPWAAEPAEPESSSWPHLSVEPPIPDESASPAEASAPVVTVPAATPRDVRVQRHETEATSTVAPGVTPTSPEEPALTVVPTVARSTAEPAREALAPVDGGRALPVADAPPPPRPTRPEPAVARSLPVLQRAVTPNGPAPSASPVPVDARPAPARIDASVTTTAPAGPHEVGTTPLSSFAEAIEQLSVQAEVEHAPVEPTAPHGVVAGPVVPGPRASATEPAAEPAAAAVQREVVADATAPPAPQLWVAQPEVPVAPLVGVATAGGAAGAGPAVQPAVQPPVQRAASEDLAALPVVPVACDEPSGGGAADVPRLAVATTPTSPTASGPGASVSVPVALSVPVVARTSLAPIGAGLASPGAPLVATPAEVHPMREARRTVPLTGSRPTLVQRSRRDVPPEVAASVREPVRPLRFEGLAGPASPGSPRAAVPPTVRPTVPAASLQRSGLGLPAVAPGLVGPGPGASSVPAGPAAELQAAAVAEGPATWSRAGLPTYGRTGPAERGVQRLAAPTTPPPSAGPMAPSARPVPVRSLPFDQMFAGASQVGATDASYADPGWTTVDLPVIGEGLPAVQRAVDTAAVTVEPIDAREPPPTPALPPAAPTTPTAAPAAGVPAPGATDLDEMARRLFDPLSARLRAELWMDRERSGLVLDARC